MCLECGCCRDNVFSPVSSLGFRPSWPLGRKPPWAQSSMGFICSSVTSESQGGNVFSARILATWGEMQIKHVTFTFSHLANKTCHCNINTSQYKKWCVLQNYDDFLWYDVCLVLLVVSVWLASTYRRCRCKLCISMW